MSVVCVAEQLLPNVVITRVLEAGFTVYAKVEASAFARACFMKPTSWEAPLVAGSLNVRRLAAATPMVMAISAITVSNSIKV